MAKTRRILVQLVSVLAAVAGVATAQTDTPAAFEVASVKPTVSTDNGVSINTGAGGAFTATNVPLRMLIALAYDIRDFQITGGPNWMGTERYDVVAHPPKDAIVPESQAERNQLAQQRVRALLADRFHLVVHVETGEMPVYALVIAKNGPNLREDKDDNPQQGITSRGGMLKCTKVSMKVFAERGLAPRLGTIVLDKTGLAGTFDFELHFVDEGPPKPGVEPKERVDGNEPSGPSLAAALQEQLGLKLETQKAPVQTIVVDRAERPSAN